MKPLRILLSAYACEPGKGSEPGVGWNWALTLAARGHQVWVLTRTNNRSPIEQIMVAMQDRAPQNLHFIYYDLPAWAKWWKRGRRGVHLYYMLWQWGAYRLARQWHARIDFDLVHHVTFVSARQPSFMGNLGIPFIFGPVAGGERAPLRLRKGYSLHGWINDNLRDVANGLVRIDPFMHHTFARADRIYATSEETRQLIPARYRHKTTVQLAIAMEIDGETGANQIRDVAITSHGPRILFVGQFVSWKGMHMGLHAFARLLDTHPGARLTMVGEGPEEVNWKGLARKLKITEQIEWLPWLPRAELAHLYQNNDIFFFPSLHDSGGMVVLEAMANGLPVVCLKLGGPGVMVDASCGSAIDVTDATAQKVIQWLADALIEFAIHPDLLRHVGEGAIARALTYSWDTLADNIYDPFDQQAG
jgi:glycosyltransferase involved in cell wall biosynthesis